MNTVRDRLRSSWVGLGLPIVLYFGHYAARATMPLAGFDRYVRHESGFTEQATIAVAVLALLFGLLVLRQALALRERRLILFCTIFCLGCLYFSGEEASWGQHWIGWSTPDEWALHNNQDETNLHNASGLAGSLLDQLPRNVLTFAALIGGGILPLIRAARGQRYTPGSFAGRIMPGMVCVPAGLIAPLASLPEKISEAMTGDVGWPLDVNGGELKELMIATFLLVYIVSIRSRLRHERPTA